MSRVGKQKITVPNGVKIEQAGSTIKVSGPLGNLEMPLDKCLKIEVADGMAAVTNSKPDDRQGKQIHGTTRALLANMIQGVSTGFERKMEIYGTGYNLKEQGGKLVLNVGFCNPAELVIPKGLKIKIEVPATKGNEVPAKFSITGINKCELGQFAADIRKVRPPEPYQGKGIRYADEHVRRKLGKAFASGAA